MTTADARDLVAYTDWADDRTMEAAAALDPARWAEALGGSFPTLGATLAHLVSAQWIWLRRWQGERPTHVPAWASDPTPDALRAALRDIQAERRAFLAPLTDADLERPLAYTLFSGAPGALPFGRLVLHVANHSTYHRGQAAAMLRRLGAAPPPTDYLVFAVEQDARRNAGRGASH